MNSNNIVYPDNKSSFRKILGGAMDNVRDRFLKNTTCAKGSKGRAKMKRLGLDEVWRPRTALSERGKELLLELTKFKPEEVLFPYAAGQSDTEERKADTRSRMKQRGVCD